MLDVLNELKPDALIGLNAGLATYDAWMEPLRASLSHLVNQDGTLTRSLLRQLSHSVRDDRL